jgi:hypothetical protein
VRESRTHGTVRGALRNERPYRDQPALALIDSGAAVGRKCRLEAGGRASVRTLCQQGASPCGVVVTPRAAESNCVAARRGGKQLEANE